MQPQNLAFAGGFDDPVMDAQAVFRAAMNALSRPGRPEFLSFEGAVPAPLTPGLAALALTLLDSDTLVWLDPTLAAAQDVHDWLDFQTGAPLTDDPARADFALILDLTAALPLERFMQGSDDYPDRSTTLLAALPKLTGGETLHLTGPGIETSIDFAPQGLPADFLLSWHTNREQFPRGVDLLLTDDHAVAGLPRTTVIEER